MEKGEICPVCSNPKNKHTSEELLGCSKKLIEMGIMRYCGHCGLTKPADGFHDRCGKCGQEYYHTNE